MSAVEKNKRVRNAHRTNVKRLASSIKDAIESHADDRVKLKALKINLDNKMKVIQKLDEAILEQTTEEADILKEVEDSSIQEDYMFELMAQLESVLYVEPDVKPKKVKTRNSTGSSNSDEDATEVEKVRVKLPEYKIPKFYGDPIEWRGFWDQFKASIHENKKLATIHKFNYLKSYLHGEAADCIEG